MKYGLLRCGGNDQHFANVGDNLQIWALERVLKEEMGVSSEDIIYLSFSELPNYQGEPLLLLLNFFFYSFLRDGTAFLPASDHITPVFLGVHFSAEFFAPEEVSYLKKYAPIGCRDHTTLRTMEKYNIPAYLFGCITLTLPRRAPEKHYSSVFLVDVSEELLPILPETLKEQGKSVSQLRKYDHAITEEEAMEAELQGKKLYQSYGETASLVVTTRRLHCLLPCLAMGIPVVYIPEQQEPDPRFGCFHKIIPVYEKKQVLQKEIEVDWSPTPPHLEPLKKAMVSLVKERLKEPSLPLEDLEPYLEVIGEFLSPPPAIHSLEQVLTRVLPLLLEKKQYILWGMTRLAQDIYLHFQEYHPEITLVAVVDEFATAPFYDFAPIRSKDLPSFPEVPIVVTPSQSRAFIKKQLQDPYFSSCGVGIYPNDP